MSLAEPDLPTLAEDFLAQYYKQEIATLAQHAHDRSLLTIEFRDLYQHDPDLADDLLDQPDVILPAFNNALSRVDIPIDISLDHASVAIEDNHGFIDTVPVTGLSADQLGRYVAVTGQIARVTGVKHRLEEGVFVCERCSSTTRIPQPRMRVQEPYQCAACERQGPFTLDIQASTIVDQRKVKLEEPPEDRTRSEGESIPVYAQGDLATTTEDGRGLPDHAGEHAIILGVYRPVKTDLDGGRADSEFAGWLDAKAIHYPEDDTTIDTTTHFDDIQAYASGEHGDPIELCKQSITPSLEITDQLDTVLEACVAWLFNAYRIDPPGLDHVRGDLHMALIGDPGTGKSSILSSLAEIAPNCEFRSGTGLSKVGLTAAAVQEEFAGSTEWMLRPGILPRANGGHCIIDEVDDVIDDTTKAIHDALEGDQVVKIDKAGISADLPTRTALLASGNPVHGRYDRYEPLATQVNLDPALLSRMDVLLALQDTPDTKQDQEVASHYLDAYEELSGVERAHQNGQTAGVDVVDRPVPLEVFRAWVAFARESCFPELTREARETIREYYVELRGANGEGSETVPATPRVLGALVRLATAYARVELSGTVEVRHAERAICVNRECIGYRFDPESGEFDAGTVDTGTPSSQRERRRGLVETIRDLHPRSGGVLVEDAVEEAHERLGSTRGKLEHDIEKLLEKGELFAPESGEVRVA